MPSLIFLGRFGMEDEGLGMEYILHTILATPLVLLVYFVAQSTYNVLWHPLRKFPGPVLFAATGFTKAYHMVSGDLQFRVQAIHDNYGPVARIAPNELSFIEPSAPKEIYGSRPGGELSKYYKFYRVDDKAPQHIISAGKEQHSMLRRLLAHGFSARSMQEQKAVIGGFVGLLMRRLHENAAGGTKAVDLNKWFNFATFDIIGALTFGSDFNNLQSSDWHPWVKSSARNNKTVGFMAAANGVGFGPLIRWCLCSGLLPRQEYLKELDEKVRQRMRSPVEHPDFIEGLVRENKLSEAEIAVNVEAMIGAGSESTATLLSGAVNALLRHPDKLAKLNNEVRSTFKNEEDITLLSVQSLDYMLACLHETFRYYPPVTYGLPRVTPARSSIKISGHWVPGNTVVAVWQWSICHCAALWKAPYEFHPERFLSDPDFAGDALEALQPFSMGTRNCIGRK